MTPPVVVAITVSPTAAHYTGLNLNMICSVFRIQVVSGVVADVEVFNPSNMLITNGTRIVVGDVQLSGTAGTTFEQRIYFRPLSAAVDRGSYMCSSSFVPVVSNSFVINSQAVMSQSFSLAVTGLSMMLTDMNYPFSVYLYVDPTLSVTIPAIATRVLDIVSYNSFTLTCTSTSAFAGVNRAIVKAFTWTRRVGSGSDEMISHLTNGVIIVESNLDQAVSVSTLHVTTTAAGEHNYTCSSRLVVTPATDDITRQAQQTVNVQGWLIACVMAVRASKALTSSHTLAW